VLISTTALNDYVDWPGVGQVFKLTRERTIGGKTTSETVFGITSMGREKADAKKLLKLTRQHWGVEMLFYVRDVTMGEDRCTVRSGAAGSILSTIRNAAINVLNWAGLKNKAAALRRHAAHPEEAIELVKESG
jgi:hypothetical protein